jgi:hypothetical protein
LVGLTIMFLHDPVALRSQLDLLSQAETAAKQGDSAAMRTALKKFVAQTEALGNLAVPPISPVGVAFVGGWGSSMYQYAYNDPN